MSDMNKRDADIHTTQGLKNFLNEGFAQVRNIHGQRRATAVMAIHGTMTAGALRTANFDSWPKPLVVATLALERKLMALAEAAQPAIDLKNEPAPAPRLEAVLPKQPQAVRTTGIKYNGPS